MFLFNQSLSSIRSLPSTYVVQIYLLEYSFVKSHRSYTVFLHVYLVDIKISHVVDWKEEYLLYPDCDFVEQYVNYYHQTTTRMIIDFKN